MKNKIVAALLAWFVGGFGIHWFYLGDKKKGILFLLFFWTFIPTFVGFVNCIQFLLMDEHQFNERYNQ